jgi:hypothetical protein
MHRTDVLDPHSVASHLVSPTLLRTVDAIAPMLVPKTVTDPDPDPGRFRRRITLSTGISTDHACVRLPDRSPVVIATCRVPHTAK